MRIDYEGQSYDFDMADITVKQAIKIEKYLGCPISGFGERLQPSDGKAPDMMAIQTLGWLILHGGKGIPIEDTDFSVQGLMGALTAAIIAGRGEGTAAEPEVPTVAAGPSANGAAGVPLTVP